MYQREIAREQWWLLLVKYWRLKYAAQRYM